jgi:hypothetical protein
VARHLAATHDCRFVLPAARSAAKAFATDARLKALGWWRPGKGHMADAQRHTLLFLDEKRLVG